MLKIKVFKDARGQFRWSAMDGNNKIVADSAEGYATERNLVLALKNVLEEFRNPITFVGHNVPLQAKRQPQI